MGKILAVISILLILPQLLLGKSVNGANRGLSPPESRMREAGRFDNYSGNHIGDRYGRVSLTSRVVINEMMADPKGRTGTNYPEDRNEFVELYNISADPVDVRGWRITDFDATTDSIIAWTDTSLLVRYPNVVIGTCSIPPYSYALILDPEYTSPNAVGGYIQPYIFPDSLVILTVGNTTIGNGLENNDPVLLYSLDTLYADSSSFGTPFNDLDSFPFDAGDGISWERVSPYAEDSRENWIRSLDTTGSTPGRENSVLSYYDLSVLNIYNTPAVIAQNESTVVSVVVANVGYQPAYCWNLVLFDDLNKNNIEDSGERLFYTFGLPLLVQAETTISFTWCLVPSGEHTIFAVVNFTDDRNLANNRLSKIINVQSTVHNLMVVKNVFSPDHDGIDDSLLVQYNFSEPNGKLNISVYNMNGQLIRKLIDQKIFSKSGIIAWDGKKDDGQSAPIGIYIIYLEYKTSKNTITEKTSAVLARKLN
jgi:hypothetical protein